MDTFYEGAHSIIFGNKHSWNDWKLIPTSRYSIEAPTVNTYTVDVPGSNGYLDLSDSLLGFPTYKERSGSFEFIVAHDQLGEKTWAKLYEEICGYLHGRKRQCILLDDPAYYYEGRFTVDSYSAGEHYSTISIGYTLGPFKWLRWTTCGDWLWDPFDFVYGAIYKADFYNLPVVSGSQNSRRWTRTQLGAAPVTPAITVTGGAMTLKVNNVGTGKGEKQFQLQNGLNENPQIMLCCPDVDDYVDISVTGSGSISFDFRPGGI